MSFNSLYYVLALGGKKSLSSFEKMQMQVYLAAFIFSFGAHLEMETGPGSTWPAQDHS